MVESYVTDIFKEFGISEKTEFTAEEFFPLYAKYGRLQELKDTNLEFANLQPQLSYFKTTEAQLNSSILLAESPKKEQLEKELSSIIDQKTLLETQVSIIEAKIELLKNEMELNQ